MQHEQDDGDDFVVPDGDEDDEDEDDFESVASGSVARRRSTRKAAVNANGKRAAIDDWQAGERRSTRQLAAALAQQDKERETKRARTKSESPPAIELAKKGHFPVAQEKHKIVKDNELVVDAVAGKKKSKFWVCGLC